MAGVQGHFLGHLVRRGVEHFGPSAHEQIIQRLQHDAELYDNAGDDMKVMDYEFIPLILTIVITLLITASVRYTVGEVMASLAMIESPTATAIVEDKPPAYADEPDAPLEKESLLPAEAVADVEVLLVQNKPITAKIVTTMGHLTRVGGFAARWRGLRMAILYNFVHNAAVHVISSMFFGHPLFHALVYVFVSVATSRLHMLWTHTMIAQPTTVPFWRRFVARKDAKAVLMPSFVFAAAQQITILIPIGVAFALGVPDMHREHFVNMAEKKECSMLFFNVLRVLAVPASAIFVALAILLPAAVTLTRVEALLLPEDQETIVPFDRQAILANVDTTRRCQAPALFTAAWRSFDRAARWRLIKLYAKMVVIQATVVVVGLHVLLAESFLIFGERLAIFVKSSAAQLQLMAIDEQL